jgi:AcrR family transcriptional regulator
MAKTASNETKLADAALKLLTRKAWNDLTLADVAKAAKIDLASLQSLGGKPALVGLILQKFGAETAARYTPDKGASPKDRVLEVAMTWFEVNADRKPAIRALYDGLKFDPITLIAMREELVRAASWLLVLAQADTGPAAPLRALALGAIMGRAIGVWLDDDTDMSRTMARLDGDLSRAESFLKPRAKSEDN